MLVFVCLSPWSCRHTSSKYVQHLLDFLDTVNTDGNLKEFILIAFLHEVQVSQLWAHSIIIIIIIIVIITVFSAYLAYFAFLFCFFLHLLTRQLLNPFHFLHISSFTLSSFHLASHLFFHSFGWWRPVLLYQWATAGGMSASFYPFLSSSVYFSHHHSITFLTLSLQWSYLIYPALLPQQEYLVRLSVAFLLPFCFSRSSTLPISCLNHLPHNSNFKM